MYVIQTLPDDSHVFQSRKNEVNAIHPIMGVVSTHQPKKFQKVMSPGIPGGANLWANPEAVDDQYIPGVMPSSEL